MTDQLQREALAPCPFCGNDAHLVDDLVTFHAECGSCGSTGPVSSYSSGAIDCWNRRTALTQPQPQTQQATTPTIEDINRQDWANVGPEVAFHLIERHAEDWAHAGRMMEAWRLSMNQAQQAAAVPAGFKPVPVELTEEMIDAYLACNGRFHSAKTDWAAMLSAAPPAPVLPLSAWLPINSAPKDGTRILLLNSDGAIDIAGYVEQWSERDEFVRRAKDGDVYRTVREDSGYWNTDIAYFPTHWQPLPAPPITAHGAGGE